MEALRGGFDRARELEVKVEVVAALGRIRTLEARRALREILKTAEYRVLRVRALRWLAISGEASEVMVLRQYLRDREPEVRLEAAEGIFHLTRGIPLETGGIGGESGGSTGLEAQVITGPVR